MIDPDPKDERIPIGPLDCVDLWICGLHVLNMQKILPSRRPSTIFNSPEAR